MHCTNNRFVILDGCQPYTHRNKLRCKTIRFLDNCYNNSPNKYSVLKSENEQNLAENRNFY